MFRVNVTVEVVKLITHRLHESGGDPIPALVVALGVVPTGGSRPFRFIGSIGQALLARSAIFNVIFASGVLFAIEITPTQCIELLIRQAPVHDG
nr:hypothetical protein [Rhodopirellula sp. SM50]